MTYNFSELNLYRLLQASSTPAKSDLVASGGYEPSGVGPRASASLEKMRGQ